MYLVQLFLPLYDNDGNATPREHFGRVREELAERFGGVTTHSRAPVEGLWKEHNDSPAQRDDLLIFEVLAEEIDRDWWRQYRTTLEEVFKQEQVLIRAERVEIL